MIFYVSPAERSPAIKSLGRYSSLPERHGADILAIGSRSRVGFQRKEVGDFFNSLQDGRLSYELAQLTNSDLLTHSVLIIEGRLDWTTDGESTRPYQSINLSSFQSLTTSIQLGGTILHYTLDSSGTCECVRSVSRYLDKPTHTSLQRRVSTRNPWGRTSNRGFALHLLQSFPGVGVGLAGQIYDYFRRVPLRWDVTEQDLLNVPGIGPRRATELYRSIEPVVSPVETSTESEA